MTTKEMARLEVANKLIERRITVEDAAEVLGLSTRQILRIKKGVMFLGPEAVIHGNMKRKLKNAIDSKLKKLVAELKVTKYTGANFTHFTELLERLEGIVLSRPTVHRILRYTEIASPKRKRKIRAHKLRARKDCPSLMIHLDASPYYWLGGDELTLHGAIDDATSLLTFLANNIIFTLFV